jgi:hypothetical protein
VRFASYYDLSLASALVRITVKLLDGAVPDNPREITIDAHLNYEAGREA